MSLKYEPASVQGSGESKEELLALAKEISVTLKSMNEPVSVAAGAYVVGKVIAISI